MGKQRQNATPNKRPEPGSPTDLRAGQEASYLGCWNWKWGEGGRDFAETQPQWNPPQNTATVELEPEPEWGLNGSQHEDWTTARTVTWDRAGIAPWDVAKMAGGDSRGLEGARGSLTFPSWQHSSSLEILECPFATLPGTQARLSVCLSVRAGRGWLKTIYLWVWDDEGRSLRHRSCNQPPPAPTPPQRQVTNRLPGQTVRHIFCFHEAGAIYSRAALFNTLTGDSQTRILLSSWLCVYFQMWYFITMW